MRKQSWMAVVVWLAIVVGAPVAGHLFRRGRTGRCAFDGQPIVPVYRARIVDAVGHSHEFCCLACAEQWIRSDHAVQQLFVTDEISGAEISSGNAFFVPSRVVTTPTTGNRIHAFVRKADALRHAEASGGRLLREEELPEFIRAVGGRDGD